MDSVGEVPTDAPGSFSNLWPLCLPLPCSKDSTGEDPAGTEAPGSFSTLWPFPFLPCPCSNGMAVDVGVVPGATEAAACFSSYSPQCLPLPLLKGETPADARAST